MKPLQVTVTTWPSVRPVSTLTFAKRSVSGTGTVGTVTLDAASGAKAIVAIGGDWSVAIRPTAARSPRR